MDEFSTIAKLWPSGTDLDLGTDSNILLGGATFSRHAADYVTSVDGTKTYRFLFWNTGRHMTNRRRVKWIFTQLGWGHWTATRWYGTPGGGPPGVPRVRADAFTIGGDMPLVDTPIDPSSTYAPGAWPFNGNDHEIGTANAGALVVPKDPFPITVSSAYDFAGWLQLTFGGDDNGEYVETDIGPLPGTPTFFDHAVAGPFAVAAGASADLIATYGYLNKPRRLIDWFNEVMRSPTDFSTIVDPSPEDRLRLRLLGDLIRQAEPTRALTADLENLIKSAPQMSGEELKRAAQSLKNTLELGKTALSALDAQMKRGGKQ
jgi:hypothetical protein